MKKSTLLLCAFLLFGAQAFSQKVKVVGNEQVPLPKSQIGYNPVLSPSGDYVLLTGGDQKGLQKFDLKTQELRTISTDRGAGFDPCISEDGKHVVFRSQKYEKRLRYTSVKSVDLESGDEAEILKPTRDLEGLSMKENTVFAVENGALKVRRISGRKLAQAPAVSSVKKGQLYLTHNRKTRLLSPAGREVNYLWSAVSPDGTKLLYYVIEHGKAYVSNLDGSNPVSLGVLRAPKWMGNDWVVGMVDRDNGETIIESKIVMVAADGRYRTQLTGSSVIATNPSGSADATKIVYNTEDGKIFLMNLEISQ